MPDEFKRAEQIFIDEMGSYFRTYGTSELLGRLFGMLILAGKPMSLQEIAGALAISKAAASIHVRTLERLDLCRKLPPSKDRKDYYMVEDDFAQTLLRGSARKVEGMLAIAEKMAAALSGNQKEAELKSEQQRAARSLLEFRDFLRFYNDSTKEIFARWETMRAKAGEGEKRD